MYCVQKRIYYHDCNVMKKHCCSCDLVCCMSKLSLKSDVGVQTNFSDKQTNIYKNIDPNILIELFGKYYSGCYNGEQSIVEAEAILGELRWVGTITCEQYNKFLGNCFVKWEQK